MLYFKQSLISKCIFASLLFFTAFNLHAKTPIKSVDADGNVTYSDQPVTHAKIITKIPIEEGPTSSEINTAQQQANKNIKAAGKIDKQNAQKLQKQKADRKAKAPASAPSQPDVIFTGGTRLNPDAAEPGPQPPINHPPTNHPGLNHPGINLPVTIQPAP